MDVHANNWRYIGKKCDFLVHVIFPSRFLIQHLIHHDDMATFRVHTRFNAGGVTKYQTVYGRFFSGDVRGLNDVSSGLFLSLPLVLKDGTYNPYDVAVVRLKDGQGRIRYLKFFYLTLVEGLTALSTEGNEIENLKHDLAAPTAFDEAPLQNLFQAASDNSRTVLNQPSLKTSVEMLCELLTPKRDAVSKHHQALEEPGDIRGLDGKITRSVNMRNVAAKPSNKPLLKFKVNFIPNKELQPKTVRVTNVFSRAFFFICYYGRNIYENNVQLKSVLDVVSAETLIHLDPISVPKSELEFLDVKQNSFVDTLEYECVKNNNRLSQMLPVFLEKDRSTLHLLTNHFTEACLSLRRIVSENSAWVRAAASISAKKKNDTVWIDFIALWETGEHNLGVEISPVLKSTSSHSQGINLKALWNELLHTNTLLSVVKGTATACVIVDTSLTAWLLLPGGFAIKGYYLLSGEDAEFVIQRYG